MADMDQGTLSEEARRLHAFALRFLTVTPLRATTATAYPRPSG